MDRRWSNGLSLKPNLALIVVQSQKIGGLSEKDPGQFSPNL